MRVIVDGWSGLDRSALNDRQIQNVMERLTIWPRRTTDIASAKDPEPVYLYDDDQEKNLLKVPREFYRDTRRGVNEEILKVSNGVAMGGFKSHFAAEGPFAEQATALRVLEHYFEEKPWGGAILQAGCGSGKTVMALEFAHRRNRKTLILVHKEFFLDQWTERIEEFYPGAVVGRVQGKLCEYDVTRDGRATDFVIGMLQSLALDSEGGKYPAALYKSFGTVISDETHRVSSQTWSGVIPRFTAAVRLGLTATPRRADGSQDVFFMHIGPIAYKMKTQSMIPKIRRIFTDCKLKPIHRGDYRVSAGNLNSAQAISQLASDKLRTRQIVEDVCQGVVLGRKIMIVSERLDHLREMGEQLKRVLGAKKMSWTPTVDYYVGQWFTGRKYTEKTKTHKKGDPIMKKRTREELERAKRANIVLCTKQIIEEGADIPAIDVIVLSTPMSDVEQTVGRVRRWCKPNEVKCKKLCPWRAGKCKGKPKPLVVDVVDREIPLCQRRAAKRQEFYEKIGCFGGDSQCSLFGDGE